MISKLIRKSNLFRCKLYYTYLQLFLIYRRNSFRLFNKKKGEKYYLEYYFVHLYHVRSVKSLPGEESLP